MKYQGYKDLAIYTKTHKLAVEIHEMTLHKLPKFEMYEEGQQIRRSSKSAVSNIVEGFALRKYPREFFRYLMQSYGSVDETKEHLSLLFETKSLKDEAMYRYFHSNCEEIGKMLYGFISTHQRRMNDENK